METRHEMTGWYPSFSAEQTGKETLIASHQRVCCPWSTMLKCSPSWLASSLAPGAIPEAIFIIIDWINDDEYSTRSCETCERGDSGKPG